MAAARTIRDGISLWFDPGRVAQLARAPRLHRGGRPFESGRAHCTTVRHNGAMDLGTLWRAALVQAALVAAVAVALGTALDRDFFASWGWLAGPAAWFACALATARVLRLPTGPTLAGAALAGVPSLIAVPFGIHWVGAVVGIPLFAVWCARLAPRHDLDSTAPAPMV